MLVYRFCFDLCDLFSECAISVYVCKLNINSKMFAIINSRHPDKSNDPIAESKFVEIKKAYELLADNDRRSAYDLHGVTHEDAFASRNGHDYSQYGRFATDPFEEFFG